MYKHSRFNKYLDRGEYLAMGDHPAPPLGTASIREALPGIRAPPGLSGAGSLGALNPMGLRTGGTPAILTLVANSGFIICSWTRGSVDLLSRILSTWQTSDAVGLVARLLNSPPVSIFASPSLLAFADTDRGDHKRSKEEISFYNSDS
jgi:hypothetical protein